MCRRAKLTHRLLRRTAHCDPPAVPAVALLVKRAACPACGHQHGQYGTPARAAARRRASCARSVRYAREGLCPNACVVITHRHATNGGVSACSGNTYHAGIELWRGACRVGVRTCMTTDEPYLVLPVACCTRRHAHTIVLPETHMHARLFVRSLYLTSYQSPSQRPAL